MNTQIITANKLYILSGPSASGKSTLFKELKKQGLGDDAWLSTDSIRTNILGYSKELDQYGEKHNLYGWEIQQPQIFNIIDNMLGIRMQEKLTTFLDATNLTDSIRHNYIKIAEKHGMPYEVLIFDVPVEELKTRLAKRLERFDGRVVEEQYQKFQKTSAYNYRVIQADDSFVYSPSLLQTNKIDVIGDVHGLYDNLIKLLTRSEWNVEDGFLKHKHDQERKILFLGDIVDRGQQSIDVVRFVMRNKETAHMILGNHEHKLLKSIEDYFNTNQIRGRSFSSSETFAQFLKLDENEQKEIYSFLNTKQQQLTLWCDANSGLPVLQKGETQDLIKIGFVHSDINYFNPYGIPASIAYYGRGKLKHPVDTDQIYQDAYDKGINDHIIIRGHIQNTSKQTHIFSLEDEQAYEGNLVLLPVDKFVQKIIQKQSIENAFNNSIVKEKCSFNFDKHTQKDKWIRGALYNLESQTLVRKQADDNGGLFIYKYHKKVFFKNLWHKHPALLKARGLVLDFAGNIVQHPFDKIFNFGENNTGNDIPLNTQVQVVEKLNGFLGCVTKHPFKKNELLVTTTGSFNSDFVQYINDFITPELKGKLLSFLSNNDLTLMFEVIHPKDPHIIQYNKEDEGLWLIGAREKNIHSKALPEDKLDEFSIELGFKRPKHYTAAFGDVVDSMQTSTLEGCIVRSLETQEPILKIKTNYYLTTKFIGRLSQNNIKHMFTKTDNFKEEKMDEEYYHIVDSVVSTYSMADFMNMDNETKTEQVRQIINEHRKDNTFQESKKLKP